MEENNNISEKKETEPKKIEVIAGDGELNISPVHEHLEVEKPRPKDNRTIIIPEVKDNISRKEDNYQEPLSEDTPKSNQEDIKLEENTHQEEES